MLCHYWYFKDVEFKFEPHVCNKCHDVLMNAYELKKKYVWERLISGVFCGVLVRMNLLIG